MSAKNMLHLPFRRSHAVSLSAALKQYISSKYDQHPDMFAEDLLVIDRLRADAVNVQEPHASGVSRLVAYAAQLKWMGAKFPIDVGADFSWCPALGFNTSTPVCQNNIRFELANVLFNLASLYSHLAISLNMTPENLKTACKYFCQSAGVLAHLRTDVVPSLRSSPPEDMDEMTLRCLEDLLLAQAQECFWQKAVKDGLKDGSIARLAAKVSDLYATAGDYGVKSDTVSTDWIHHMTAKHHHFAAAAQYRQSLDCLEKHKYGEEVSRLRDSITCVNDALKETRWINKAVLGDLNGLKSRVAEDLKRAERDNDMIYLIPVPPKSELKLLDRASMVEAKAPAEVTDALSMIGENAPLGRPLFAKLVPYAVHVAASVYADRRDRLVNQTIGELESMTLKLRELLQSLNLPGSLQALEKPLGLPPGLVSHAEEMRQQDGLNRLHRSLEDTAKLKTNDRAMYTEGVELLRAEKDEDDRARARYGTDRWRREPSEKAAEKLYTHSTELDGYFSSAANSDGLVRDKLKESENVLRVLTGTNRDLEAYVPSSRKPATNPQVEKEASRLRQSMNEVSRLESRRKRKMEALKEKAKGDSIHPALVRETARLEREFPMQKIEASQFEDLFEKHLHQYDNERDMLAFEQKTQDEIEEQIREANRAFANARKGAGDSSTKEREKALQDLENGYLKYKEIISNIDVGRKFYNDLAKLVSRFREDCKNLVNQRRIEAAQMENDISNTSAMASLNISQPSHAQPQHRNTSPKRPAVPQPQQTPSFATAPPSQAQQQQQLPSDLPQPQAHLRQPDQRDEPLTAPQPTRVSAIPPLQQENIPTLRPTTHTAAPAAAANTGPAGAGGIWSPEMGIKFGASAPTTTGPGSAHANTNGNSNDSAAATAGAARTGVPVAPVPGQWDPSRGLRFS